MRFTRVTAHKSPLLHTLKHTAGRTLCSIGLLLAPMLAWAETPFGWISNGQVSAYTLAPGEFELNGQMKRVNDALDVLNFRADVLRANTRLTGNSGDLEGIGGEIRVGVLDGLELFYRQQNQKMTLKVNMPTRINVLDFDTQLDTDSKAGGFKLVFYESKIRDRSSAWRSAALEVTWVENRSRDFGGLMQRINFSNTVVLRFDPPQRFDLDRLADSGWQSRLIYTLPLSQTTSTSATAWAGVGSMKGSSGTSFKIDVNFLADAFLQTFDTREKHMMMGASLNWQRFHRFPVQLSYEYRHLFDREQTIFRPKDALDVLPSFLSADNVTSSVNNNHILSANVAWWITPRIYAGLGGKLLKHQFVGLMPHYNNPLSGRFSSITYGYAEVTLGFHFGTSAITGLFDRN